MAALDPATVLDELETRSLYLMVQPMPQQMLEHMRPACNALRLAFCIKACVGLGMGRVTILCRVTNIRRLPAESEWSRPSSVAHYKGAETLCLPGLKEPVESASLPEKSHLILVPVGAQDVWHAQLRQTCC